MKYCNECKRHVEPVKSKWSWKWFFLLALTLVGWIFYTMNHFIFKKEDRCPYCDKDQLSKLSPEERADRKRKRERRLEKRAEETGKEAEEMTGKPLITFDPEAEKLLQEAGAAFEDGDTEKAVKLIDKAIKIYDEDEEVFEVFPAFKKKARYLYQSGRNDEAWELYNNLYHMCEPHRSLMGQLFEEKGKMLIFEEKPLVALREMVMAKIYFDWTYLDQGREEEIDYEWTENELFEKLAEKAARETRWEEARGILVEAYDDLENLAFADVNLKVKKALR
jgi:tetratricopeptide (TPR) repeat protein